jgi:4-amino-4-deoxy-L-arabinose transferase-like glycosyltransferase
VSPALRTALIVFIAASLLRLWFMAGIPLIITNDGAGYLHWAQMLLAGEPVQWPSFRTPGYPLLLSGVFLVAGVSPYAVLIVQHGLAALACGLIAYSSTRLAGPRLALVAGLGCAIDPWLLALSFFALTEVLAGFLLLLASALVLHVRRANVMMAIALGLVLAAMVLVRPVLQVAVPVFLLGWVLTFSWRSRRAWMTGAVLAAALLLAIAPWLWHNQQRGIKGVSGGAAAHLWLGMAGAQLLDDDHPLPPQLRESYLRHARGTTSNERLCAFLSETGGWDDPETSRLLRAWAVHSIRSNGGEWGHAFAYALAWQLGWFPPKGATTHGFTRWQFRRLVQDGRAQGAAAANFQFSGDWEMSSFAMPAPTGPQRRYFAAVSRWDHLGIFHAVLLALALAAALIAVFRGRWSIAAVLGAAIAHYLLNAAFLFAEDRYSFPSWLVWYLAPAALVAVAHAGPRPCWARGAGSGATGAPRTDADRERPAL